MIHRLTPFLTVSCLATLGWAPLSSAQLPPPPTGNESAALADDSQFAPQTLDHGPIHEAFAEPHSYGAAEPILVDQEPPAQVDEIPPQVQPEGNNVQWIPGYWMWESELDDFIWVSGVWRDVPPGRTWVPGSWVQVDAGYQWSPGFWSAGELTEADYLPYPPESLEQGPTSAAPSADSFWIPGAWLWQDNRYAWRAGYWYAGKENWVWCPSHYLYTPRGSIFVQGYWDYPLANRGLLYAPVYWPNNGYRRGYAYRPYNLIDTTLLLSSLFIDRGYNSYYYGSPRYFRGNNRYQPWYGATRYSGRRGYDPLLAYYAWHDGRNQRDWSDQVRRRYDRGDWDRRGNRDQRDRDQRDRGPRGDRRDGDGRFDRDGFRDQRLVRNLDELGGTDLANMIRDRDLRDRNSGERGPRGNRRDNAATGRDREPTEALRRSDQLRDLAQQRRRLETGSQPPELRRTAKPTDDALSSTRDGATRDNARRAEGRGRPDVRSRDAQRSDPVTDARRRFESLRNQQRGQTNPADAQARANDTRRDQRPESNTRERSPRSMENFQGFRNRGNLQGQDRSRTPSNISPRPNTTSRPDTSSRPDVTGRRGNALDDAVRRMQSGTLGTPRQQSPGLNPRTQQPSNRRSGFPSIPGQSPQRQSSQAPAADQRRGMQLPQGFNNPRSSRGIPSRGIPSTGNPSAQPGRQSMSRGQISPSMNDLRGRSPSPAPQSRSRSASPLNSFRGAAPAASPRTSNFRGPSRSPAVSPSRGPSISPSRGASPARGVSPSRGPSASSMRGMSSGNRSRGNVARSPARGPSPRAAGGNRGNGGGNGKRGK